MRHAATQANQLLTKWLHPFGTAHFKAGEDAVHLISETPDRAAEPAALQRELRQVKDAIRALRARETALVRALMARSCGSDDRVKKDVSAAATPAFVRLGSNAGPAAAAALQTKGRPGPSDGGPPYDAFATGSAPHRGMQSPSSALIRGPYLTGLPVPATRDGAGAGTD